MKFNENLKATREKKNISIKQLAEAIEVKTYTITDWETGRSEPSINNLIKLSNYFNVTIDFLVGNNIHINDGYNEILEIINNFQRTTYKDEVNELLNGLSYKNRKKLVNILKVVKQEMFNK